jgi:chromatin assembly factor 1 subunit A
MSELNNAEIEGSTSRVRELVSTLSSRSLIPAKVLIHHDDLRPGYFGTWTRNSRIIGPRSPLAKDVVALDYGYDSGEEWEEEDPTGEDVEDGEEEEAEAGEEEDSDLDDWLVDDDEVIEVVEEREPSPSPLLMPPAPKRKVQEASKERNLEKKRKVIVPLLPFAKGPCWEKSIGSCEYDAFKSYKIHLFNGTSSMIVDVPC